LLTETAAGNPGVSFRPRAAERLLRVETHPYFLPLHIVLTGSVALIGLMALSLQLYEPRATHNAIALGCGLAVIGLIVYGRYVLHLPWISASIVYLMMFWMLHYGLAFTAVLVPDVLMNFTDWDVLWLYWPNVRIAMILGLIGAAGFVFSVGLMSGGRPTAQQVVTARNAHDSILYRVGWLVMLVGLGGTAIAMSMNGGLGVFALEYLEVRATVVRPLQTWVDTSHLGCFLAICGAGGRRWVMPLVVWSPLGFAMMLLGMRQEAMIPLVSFAIALTYRGIRFHPGLLAAAVLASLMVIPAVRMLRSVGFENRSSVNWTEVSPLEAVTELGVTLRAVKAYVDWIEQGDEYLLGASYWAPFDRQLLVRVVPDREQIRFADDVRVPSRLTYLEGAIGESSTGEAYYNFGPVGPFIYFGCVGLLFGWLERRAASTPYHCALLGIVMNIFYFNIRGHWVSVPAQLAGGLALLGVCYVLVLLTRGSTRVGATATEPSLRRGF